MQQVYMLMMRAASVRQMPCNILQLIRAGLQVDKPGSGTAYLCPHPGGYKIQHGQLRPFPETAAGPVMLVIGEAYILCTACFLMQYLGAVPILYAQSVQAVPTKRGMQIPISLLASYGKLAVFSHLLKQTSSIGHLAKVQRGFAMLH